MSSSVAAPPVDFGAEEKPPRPLLGGGGCAAAVGWRLPLGGERERERRPRLLSRAPRRR
eukprot:CAMPEP_0180824742 /NCGR_PEP_ID=MMETSP1038_2-20121128/72595_1 /TAXON_ID=632150 /ORGANISM="Azadinium spinosum, Strain 3D9" /LENGTH=58 /DNA_ID=CAMNT_0022867149 /DNA_START=123 /DNA_END=296 /DNA_ORIENTATION=-